MTVAPAFADPAVEAAFAAFPAPRRGSLLALRGLIFATADEMPEAGGLLETLKWGQPAYLTARRRGGTTVRLGVPKAGGLALLVHCQSGVIPAFRNQFPQGFRFDGNRAVLFRADEDLPMDALRLVIRHALGYHLTRVH